MGLSSHRAPHEVIGCNRYAANRWPIPVAVTLFYQLLGLTMLTGVSIGVSTKFEWNIRDNLSEYDNLVET